MRQLASIQKITEITNIENSDTLATAKVLGWHVVIKRGEYQIGDLVIYCEIDSWVPNDIAPFLSKDSGPRTYEGVLGNRLKTVKLRGTISQGLILPLDILKDKKSIVFEGMDVTEDLGIVKWERAVDASLGGVSRGNFPIEIPKTDETRVQSLRNYDELIGRRCYMHEKLEGSSVTIYKKNGEFGVCSRNINLKENDTNRYWLTVRKLRIEELLTDFDNIALQGELVGPGIQGNIYKLSDYRIYFFNVIDFSNQTLKIFSEDESAVFLKKLGLLKVPFLGETILKSQKEVIMMADGNSVLYPRQREGIVFRTVDGDRRSFKAISNNYLLKQGD